MERSASEETGRIGGYSCFNIGTCQEPPFGYENRVAKRAFGEALQAAIAAKGISVKSWAEKMIGSTHGQVFNVIAGRRTPPLDEVERWATKLGLEGRERQRFLDLAALAHLPIEIEARMLRTFAEHAEMIERFRQLGVKMRIPRAPISDGPAPRSGPSSASRSADADQRRLESDARLPTDPDAGATTRRRLPRRPRRSGNGA
jgi:hypothetical protein